MKLLLIAIVATAIAGCDNRNAKFAALPDYELSQRYGQCLAKKPTAPGKAVACENLRKECEYRYEQSGTFVCPID